MIHWFSVPIPVYVPGSEFVLFWLLAGLASFIFVAIKVEGVRKRIESDSPGLSAVKTATMILIWPFIVWAFWEHTR